MFDEKSLNTLEYGKILDMLAAHAQSEGGKAACRALLPTSDIGEAELALDMTAEADRTLFEFSVSPSFAVPPVPQRFLSMRASSARSSLRPTKPRTMVTHLPAL